MPGVVDPICVTPGPLKGIYQAPIESPWNVVIQQIIPGNQLDWSKGSNLLYVLVPDMIPGDVAEVWAQVGLKGAQVYTGRVAVGGGVNLVLSSQLGGSITPPPPSSVGEDWNSDVRPYIELSMHQAFVTQSSGDHYAYFRGYAAVNPPAPTGYLQTMWPHGSILVKHYGQN